MIKLSERIQLIYENLLAEQDVWDLCCDHGYLGVAAYKSKKFNDIYFVDRVLAIVNKLESNFLKSVQNADSNSKAFFISEDAKKIKLPVSGNVCISGVGGLSIFNILESMALRKDFAPRQFILGPQRDDIKLLALMEAHPTLQNYRVNKKIEIIEKNRSRNLFVFT